MTMILAQTDRGFSVPVSRERVKKIVLEDREEVMKRGRVQNFLDDGLRGSLNEALQVLAKYSAPEQEQTSKRNHDDDPGRVINTRGYRSNRDRAMSLSLRNFFGL